MNYEGQICRGPMERSSYMLPVAVGCSYNRCKFCTLFRHLKYRELPMEQIEAELERVRSLGGNPKHVFLGDGNAFGLAYVGQTFRQGHFRADDDEVYAFLFAEGSNAAQVFYPDGDALGHSGHSITAGQGVELFYRRALGERYGQGMFPAAATDDSYFHYFASPFSTCSVR